MIKGLSAALITAVIITAIVLLVLNFFDVIAQFAVLLGVNLTISAIILFALFFLVFGIILFIALFYFLAEKTPKIQPGEYKLEDEKGKNE